MITIHTHTHTHTHTHVCLCLVTHSCLTLCDPMEHTRLLCPWGYSKKEYWSEFPCLSPGDLSNSGIKPKSPPLQVDSLPSELPRKPKKTGVGSLSLLLGIFQTHELSQGSLHCRQILYLLTYQRSPVLSLKCCLILS